MGIPILSVRDDQGNIIPIPAIQGEAGPPGQKGDTGPAGAKGDKGDTGDPGPNLINQNTLTPMAGILMGSGGSVKTAVSGVDYAAPADVAAKLDADDYTRTINTATTTGTASNYILTLDPAPDALVQGMILLVNFHVGSEATMTPPVLSVNGFGGKYLMPVGVNSARPFAAGVHIVFYDGTYWRMIDNAFLSVNGGTMYGNIIPNGALMYNLGSSTIPWQYMYATAGRFSNSLTVGGNSVWHQGNLKIASGTIGITPDTTGESKMVTVDISGYGFTGTPSVFANPQSTGVGKVFTTATNATNTSFQIYGIRNDGGGGFSCSWLAIGT